MITSTYSRLPVERCIILSTGETKLRTLEETGRCLVPPEESDDGSSKTISTSLSILVTSGASLDQSGVTKGLHGAGSVVEGSYTVEVSTIPIPLPCIDSGKAGSGVLLTTNDTLLAMPLNVHISPIISTHNSDTRAKLKGTTPKAPGKPEKE